MSDTFMTPGRIIYGNNAVSALIPLLPAGKKPFIITGNIVKKQKCFAELTSLLKKNKIQYSVFSDINGEPTDKMVEAGLQAYKENNCSCFIAIGGGSPMDLMKAVAVLSVSGGHISDYNGKNIDAALPFMAAVPTTAGTGSEATKFTVITDTEKGIKMLLKGEALIPNVAVLDPSFTVTAPKSVTAHTGLDALTHAIESYTSRKAQTMTDTFALSAIKRICTYLPKAYANGNDLEARYQMSIAALEAGICINNASVTIVHGMSRPIGALFHVQHGLSNAMLLPKCLAFAMPGAPEKFADMGRFACMASQGDGNEAAGEKFLGCVEKICQICNVPTLAEYGVNRDEFFSNIDKMADDALASGSPSNTMRTVTKNDVTSIYRSLW